MRLGEDEVASTSQTYAPFLVPERKEPLFGYDRNRYVAPWAKKRYSLSIEGLHQEVVDVFHWLQPSELETSVRMMVFERVKSVIHSKWKHFDVRVSVFGSLRTKLFLPTSDIDVLVECDMWGADVTPILNETANALGETGMCDSVAVYGDAFVPIVKMVDRETRLSIDISFNTVQGVKAADYIEKVKKEFPVVEPLVLVLKQFLIQRNLNQTYTGGLSSYGLILLLISFLQIHALSVRGKSYFTDGVNMGELLMRFFEVYSQEFNYLDVGISVTRCCYLRKSEKQQRNGLKKGGEPVLSLEDPLLDTNEVGRPTFNFAGIQSAFAQALQVLKGVFVRDRPRCPVFSERVYTGSMMSLIMPLTPQQVHYRNWLKVSCKGFSLTPPPESVRISQLITNTLLSPVVNLDTLRWHSAACALSKTAKILTITDPNEGQKKQKQTESDTSGIASSTDEDRKTSDDEDRKNSPTTGNDVIMTRMVNNNNNNVAGEQQQQQKTVADAIRALPSCSDGSESDSKSSIAPSSEVSSDEKRTPSPSETENMTPPSSEGVNNNNNNNRQGMAGTRPRKDTFKETLALKTNAMRERSSSDASRDSGAERRPRSFASAVYRNTNRNNSSNSNNGNGSSGENQNPNHLRFKIGAVAPSQNSNGNLAPNGGNGGWKKPYHQQQNGGEFRRNQGDHPRFYSSQANHRGGGQYRYSDRPPPYRNDRASRGTTTNYAPMKTAAQFAHNVPQKPPSSDGESSERDSVKSGGNNGGFEVYSRKNRKHR